MTIGDDPLASPADATPIGRFRQIVLPVDDVGAATRYYEGVLGLPLMFQDGDRWAALDLGGLTLALAGPSESDWRQGAILGIKVTDLDVAREVLVGGGGQLTGEVRTGAHERRAEAIDRFGNRIVLYQPLEPPS